MTNYRKKFGIDQSKGIEDELAKDMYPNYDALLLKGILQKKVIDGKTFVYHREIIAGTETGVIDAKKTSRVRSLKDEDWDASKSVLSNLGWFFQVKESEADGAYTSIAYSKLSEAVCAHDKMLKDGVAYRDKLSETEGGMFIIVMQVFIIHK